MKWLLSFFIFLPLSLLAQPLVLSETRREALHILTDAALSDSKLAPLYHRISMALSTEIQILDSSHSLFPHCQKKDALYQRDSHQIFICPDLLKQKKEFRAQKLIHEAAHAAGFLDECQATHIEFFALESAGRTVGPLSYDCGL